MLDKKRREFITLLGSAAACWPLAARAQQPGKVWRMGFVARGHERFYDALFEGLRELGYAEGRNLIVERRYAGDNTQRFQEFAAEMARLNVDIIIVVTTPAALALKKATTTIPIVFPNAINPVETGVVASLAHPGGNVTGGAAQTAVRYLAQNVWRYSRKRCLGYRARRFSGMRPTPHSPSPGGIRKMRLVRWD